MMPSETVAPTHTAPETTTDASLPAAEERDEATPPGNGGETATATPATIAVAPPGASRRGRVVVGSVLGLLGVALVAGVAWRVAETIGADESRRPDGGAVAVEAADVEVRTVRALGRYSGSVRAGSHVTVAPQISGRINAIHLDLGDEVRRGDPLFELDEREVSQQLHQAEANLRVAQATLLARQADYRARLRDLERMRELYDEDARIVTRSDLDAAESAYEQAEANVSVAESTVQERDAALEAARIRAEHTRVVADWLDEDTVKYVAERHRERGDTVSANSPVLSVVDLNRVRVVVTVPEREYVRLQVGQTATITAEAYRGHEFTGTVRRISPSFDDALREARVEIEVLNEDHRLKPGMFVRVELVYDTIENATTVPATALFSRTGVQGVLLIEPPLDDDGESPTARFVPVTLGPRDGDYVQILDPPLEGRVITLGGHLVEDGGAVRIAEE